MKIMKTKFFKVPTGIILTLYSYIYLFGHAIVRVRIYLGIIQFLVPKLGLNNVN